MIEDLMEQETPAWHGDPGCTDLYRLDNSERESYRGVLLTLHLRTVSPRLNSQMPLTARWDTPRQAMEMSA